MKKRNFWFCILIFSYQFAIAQNPSTNSFEIFANKQDSLFQQAYEQRDTAHYINLLSEFVTQYNKLDTNDKKLFTNNFINAFYNLSCTYSIMNNKKKALEYLAKAINAGYMNYTHIMSDIDLDNIKNERKFHELVLPLREMGDYIYILKKAAAYNLNDEIYLPQFTYQSSDNPNLIALRKTFNLDSIAGYGNEISKILNLMHWVHNLIPHDGNHENPAIRNALNMITVCKKENRGLNCRGLATVLNECYLSLGIKSRFVTCLPKDSLGIDYDCHVINMVYSTTIKKWIWIDPTFDTYVMNEKGDLLSIEEVRKRIINDEPLIISPEANWNHKISETKEYYLYNYMAKNLYRLQCPINSEFDLETRVPGKKIEYIQLLPLDYFNQKEETPENPNQSQTTLYFRNTNNPDIFWQKPQ